MQDQGDEINRMLARSLTDSFAHVSLWMPSRDEAVYLASDSPLELDLARFEAAFDDPRLGGALRDAGFADAYDLLGSFVLGTEAMHRWTDGVGPVRDDHPTVEYYLSYGGRPHDRTALLELAGSPLPYLRGETPVDRSRLEPSLELAHALLGVSQMIFARQYDRAADRLDELIAKHGESMWLHHFRFDYLDCMVARPGAPLPSGAEAARTRASE